MSESRSAKDIALLPVSLHATAMGMYAFPARMDFFRLRIRYIEPRNIAHVSTYLPYHTNKHEGSTQLTEI